MYILQVAEERCGHYFICLSLFFPENTETLGSSRTGWHKSSFFFCNFPQAAPTLLEGRTPCIAHVDEQKVSINFY